MKKVFILDFFTRAGLYGPGPWEEEPDIIYLEVRQYVPAVIVRNFSTGALCGFFGVPERHSLYKAFRERFSRFDVKTKRVYFNIPIIYRGHVGCIKDIQPTVEADPSLWWFGFSCTNAVNDYWPRRPAFPPSRLHQYLMANNPPTYKTVEDVIELLKSFADYAMESPRDKKTYHKYWVKKQSSKL